jgi:hypothetical protein
VDLAPEDFRSSFHPDALWGTRAEEGKDHATAIVHWDGEAWREETEVPSHFATIAAVLPLSATSDEVVALAADYWGESSEALLLKGGCWQPLHDFLSSSVDIGFGYDYSPHSLMQLDDKTVGWLASSGSGHDLYTFELASFPNWD